jgi:undecaprenyl-diphosphatase
MVQLVIDRFIMIDAGLSLAVFRLTGRRFLDRTMRLFSRAGDGYLYPAVAAAVWIRVPEAGVRFTLSMAVAFAVELAVQKALKHGLKRLRPCLAVPGVRNLVPFPDVFSFPSGHTAGAFLAAVQVSSLVPGLSAPLFTVAALIGASRVYNGVHYPSDVAAGAALGSACGMLALAIF